MALWKKLWVLFTVIWVVVAALNVATILAFAEGLDRDKVWRPLLLGIGVPPLVYLLARLWDRWRNRGQSPKGKSGSEPE